MNEKTEINDDNSAPRVPPPPANPAPRKGFRFLAIYILLLFSVSAVFIVTSYFAARNSNIKQENYDLNQKVISLDKRISSLDTQIAALSVELTDATDALAQTGAENAAMRDDITVKDKALLELLSEKTLLQEQIKDLQQQLDEIAAAPDDDLEP